MKKVKKLVDYGPAEWYHFIRASEEAHYGRSLKTEWE
jgi:hypothetical protein